MGELDTTEVFDTARLISLKSADGDLVPVEAFYLLAASKAWSRIIKDEKSAVSIPASTDTVRLFVALLKRDIFAQPDQEITGDLLPAVVDLATRYDCHAVNKYIILLLLPSSDFVAPWTLFLVASRLDLVWLARRAIKRFTTKDYDWTGLGEDDDRIFKSQIDGRYLVALTRSALACWAGQHVVPYQHVYIRPIIIPRSELRRDPVYGDVECTPPPVHGTTMASLSFSAERLADAFTVAPAPRTAEEPAGSQRVDQVTQTIKLFSKDGEGVDVELHHLQASSVVFRDMTTAAVNTFNDELMELDVCQAVLTQFLSLMKGDWTPDPSSEDPFLGDLLPGIVDLALKFDCVPILNIITLLLKQSSNQVRAWTLFIVASKLDSMILAKKAIERFSQTDYDWTGGMADGRKLYKAAIDDRYTVGLVTATLSCWSKLTAKTSPLAPKTIADAFEVAPRSTSAA